MRRPFLPVGWPLPCLPALLVLAGVTLVACAGACGGGSRAEAEVVPGPPALAGTEPLGPPDVIGTTVDAATGRPVEAALTAPDGTRARSDVEGHFRLHLPAGTEGPLLARTADGRVGEVRLRPLLGGRLEVVIHLRREGL